MQQSRPPIFLYTDGAASGNPGPGGFGVVLRCGAHEKEISEGYRLTTNNRMELLAVIKGLEAIKWDNAEVHVWSDSSYVVKAVNEGWLENWKRAGFAKKKNVDLWLRFDAVYRKHRVSFNWLKGHAGHPENERCDAYFRMHRESTGYCDTLLLSAREFIGIFSCLAVKSHTL